MTDDPASMLATARGLSDTIVSLRGSTGYGNAAKLTAARRQRDVVRNKLRATFRVASFNENILPKAAAKR